MAKLWRIRWLQVTLQSVLSKPPWCPFFGGGDTQSKNYITGQDKMIKRGAESDCRHGFNEQGENELLFMIDSPGKSFCIISESNFHIIEDMIFMSAIKHSIRLTWMKFALRSELRKEYMTKEMKEIIRQNIFIKVSCEDIAIIEASYEIVCHYRKKKKRKHFLTEKKLSGLVSKYLHTILIIKVLKGKQTKLLYQGRQLWDASRNSLRMYPNNWRALSILALSFL